jgi:hypothetical protein
MKWVFVLGCLGIVVACTKRNPAYCGDGTCVDPSLPYCDIDGAIGGMPGTCIAVTCTPGELAICRGDAAVTCASSGSNYDTVQCPLGCDPAAGGCKECTSNAQCAAEQVCDEATSHCRGCAADDECDSRVCDLDSGSCVDESAIVYAAPGASGTCSLSNPCAAMTAIVEAENATPTSIVRLLPGSYTSPLRITVPTASPLDIVGTGATMAVVGDVAAIVVDSGANAHVRDLASTSERQVQCGLASTSAPLSSILLERAPLTMIGAGLAFETQRCSLALENVDLTTNVDIIGTRDDSTFTADGFYVHATATNTIIGAGARVKIDVTNAVLEDTVVVGFFNDAGPPGSSIRFSYSTFLLANELNLCTGATAMYASVAFENSILATQATNDAFAEPINPANCSFVSTILARQPTPPSGATVADPQFASLATRDFHLRSTSPAVDAAVPATTNPDHDIEGVTRPQGMAPDLGAYELVR